MKLEKLLPETSPALKRYYRRSILPCLSFIALMLLQQGLLDRPPESLLLRSAIALMPLLGFGWMLREHVRFLREADELERRIELNSLMMAAAISLVVGFALLFLLDAEVITLRSVQVAAWLVLLPNFSYLLIRHVLHRHYR